MQGVCRVSQPACYASLGKSKMPQPICRGASPDVLQGCSHAASQQSCTRAKTIRTFRDYEPSCSMNKFARCPKRFADFSLARCLHIALTWFQHVFLGSKLVFLTWGGSGWPLGGRPRVCIVARYTIPIGRRGGPRQIF